MKEMGSGIHKAKKGKEKKSRYKYVQSRTLSDKFRYA